MASVGRGCCAVIITTRGRPLADGIYLHDIGPWGSANQQIYYPRQRVFQIVSRHDHIDHAMIQQIFRTLEPFGKFFPDRLLDHPSAGKTDNRPRLGNRDITQHRKRGRYAPGRRIGENDDIGKTRFLDLLHRDRGARHLHQRQNTFLHARAAR